MAELVGVKETGFRPIAFLALLAAPGVATFPDFCPFADFFLLWAVFTTLAETSGRDVDFFFENALCGTDLTFFDNFTLFEVFVRLGAADLLEDTAFFFLAVTLPLRALLEGSANLDDGDRRLLKLLPGTAARSDPEGTSGPALKRSASRSNPASFLRQPPGCQFYSRFRQTRATRLPFPSSRLLLGPICFELGYPFDSGNRGRFTPTCSMRVRGGLCARSGRVRGVVCDRGSLPGVPVSTALAGGLSVSAWRAGARLAGAETRVAVRQLRAANLAYGGHDLAGQP